MKYTLKNPSEVARAQDYLAQLTKLGATVEIKKVVRRRTLNQNSYLHLLLGAFGAHFGYTLEEAKHIYKTLNHGIYRYEKNGRLFMKSSAELTTEEMAKSIDVFRLRSLEQGYPLPAASDQDWLQQLENTIKQNQRYL